MNKNKQHHAQKIWPLARIIRSILLKSSNSRDNEDYFRAKLYSEIPQLAEEEKCVNCGASMLEYVYTFSFHHGVLLKMMGDEVRRKVREGVPFTEANSIPVSRMSWPHVIQCKTSQCRFLGILAKHENARWAITKRGFAALRGELFPATVTVWRNQIEERHDKSAVLIEVFDRHRMSVEEAFFRGKKIKSDYRAILKDYNVADWVEFGKVHEGSLL